MKVDYVDNGIEFKNIKKVPMSIFSRFVLLNAAILFFQMMSFPRTYLKFKIPFLGICLISILYSIALSGKVKINNKIFIWFWIYINYGVFWGMLGLVNSKEYANDFLRLNIGWVLMYLMLVLGLNKEIYLEKIQKVMILSTLFIALYNINYYLSYMGILSIEFLTRLDMGQMIGIHDGYSQLTAHNLGSLCFLVPYTFSALLISKRKRFIGYSTKFISCVLLLSIFAVFLSGRRALWLIIIIMPIIYFFCIHVSKLNSLKVKQIIKIIIGSLMIIFIISNIFFNKIGWNYENFVERLTFKGEQKVGITYRVTETNIKISEVLEKNIILGTGGGSPAFEMTFIQIFHETGVLGLTIYLGLILWVFCKGILLMRSQKSKIEYGIPILVGCFCFFIAMWTNPYFGSFDFMWTLFLPISYINIYMNKDIEIQK